MCDEKERLCKLDLQCNSSYNIHSPMSSLSIHPCSRGEIDEKIKRRNIVFLQHRTSLACIGMTINSHNTVFILKRMYVNQGAALKFSRHFECFS
jgi:hypothetical protein